MSLDGLKPSLKISLCSNVSMQSQRTTTETSPSEWMGATLGCFLSQNVGYSSRNTEFYSFFVYLPEVMLWRTDICFLISRGDSRELCPSFTRSLQMIFLSWKEIFTPLPCQVPHSSSGQSAAGPDLPRWRCVTPPCLNEHMGNL